MIDFNALFVDISRARKAAKPEDQFTLGMLIDALESAPNRDAGVAFDFGAIYPTTFDSYRGYYEDLALGYEDGGRFGPEVRPTAATLLAAALACDGHTFHGWKGGDFEMDRATMLWVANPGCTGGTTIVGVDADECEVVLRTEKVE